MIDIDKRCECCGTTKNVVNKGMWIPAWYCEPYNTCAENKELEAEVKRLREENESLRLNMMGKSSEHWMLCSYEGIQRLHAKHDSSLAEVKRLRYHLDLMIEKFGEAYLIETLIERGEEE